jgi:hypothetical protein
VFACGKTGSGKTYLMERLTRSIKRLVVLDGKGTLGSWDLLEWNRETRAMLKNQEEVRVRVRWDIGQDVFEFWEEVMEEVYNAGNVTMYCDELYALTDKPGLVQPALRAIYTRGRELGIGAWSCTQRPFSVPLVTLSETEHFFMFRLTMDDDRSRMAEFMTQAVREPIQDRHGFWYMFAEDDAPRYVPILQAGMVKTSQPETNQEGG